MVNIESLTFDLTDCSLREQSERHRAWINSDGVAHTLRFYPGPPDWAFDLTDLNAATDFYRQQAAENGGVLLSMDLARVHGAEALRGLFKYRAPVPGSLAMYYVGILWLPFQQCAFQINVEAMEAGTTGAREAAVMVIEGDAWPKPEDEPPIEVKSARELFARLGSAPVRKLPSEDERYDASFPDHPLSRVRARLSEVTATLRLDPSARALPPYRAAGGDLGARPA